MENTSGLIPLGRAVLVKPFELKSAYKGLIEIPDYIKAQNMLIEQKAQVIAVGNSCWDDEKEPRAKVGDIVLVTKYAGYMAVGVNDNIQYRLVNDRDIFARIEEKVEENNG